MAEHCVTCDAKITQGGLISGPNSHIKGASLRVVNFVHKTEYTALCDKCGGELRSAAYATIEEEKDKLTKFLENSAPLFPMMTIQVLPGNVEFRVLGMVTSNVAVGTGLISEFSQGFSDFFGSVNMQSGMAHKVNKGEAAARGILAHKAISLGANCVIGVDVDYGVTNNNAATVNMQGTAVHVADMAQVLSGDGCAASEKISSAWSRLKDLQRWKMGRFEEGETYTA